MAGISKAGKKLGAWYLALCGQRWFYWALMVWLLCHLWSGSVKSTIDSHYWLSVLFAISVSLFIIGQLLVFCSAALNRGDATVIQAIKADLQRRWESRPTLGVFLRGPK